MLQHAYDGFHAKLATVNDGCLLVNAAVLGVGL